MFPFIGLRGWSTLSDPSQVWQWQRSRLKYYYTARMEELIDGSGGKVARWERVWSLSAHHPLFMAVPPPNPLRSFPSLIFLPESRSRSWQMNSNLKQDALGSRTFLTTSESLCIIITGPVRTWQGLPVYQDVPMQVPVIFRTWIRALILESGNSDSLKYIQFSLLGTIYRLMDILSRSSLFSGLLPKSNFTGCLGSLWMWQTLADVPTPPGQFLLD